MHLGTIKGSVARLLVVSYALRAHHISVKLHRLDADDEQTWPLSCSGAPAGASRTVPPSEALSGPASSTPYG